MVYTAPTEKSFREKGGTLSHKLCTELALIQTEVLSAEVDDLGTTATTFSVKSGSTTGKIAITAVAGAANKTLTLSNAALTDNRTISFPDLTGTVSLRDAAEALTNKTNVSVTSQSSAYDNSALNVGKYGTPIADTLLLDNILVSFNNSSGVNKTAADTSSMTMYVGNKTTAAVTNNKMQGILASSTIAHNMFDAYSVQAHMAVTDNCGTQGANAHVTGISGKFSVSSGKTLATGWGTAILGIVEGAGAVTQMCSVCSLVQEAGCSSVQSMLYLNNDGTATRGINFVGKFTKGIDFNTATLTQGIDNYILSLGTINSTISYTPNDSYVPIQINLSSVANSGTSGNQTIGAAYFKTAAITAAQADHQLATLMVRARVEQNIWDAYGLQSHLQLYASMATKENNAHLTAISGKVTFSGTPTISKGWITAGLFIIEGAGTVTQMCHGVSIVNEAGSTGAQSMLHLNDDVGTVPYFSFAGADGDGKGIYTSVPQTLAGSITVLINGTPKFIPFYDGQHA